MHSYGSGSRVASSLLWSLGKAHFPACKATVQLVPRSHAKCVEISPGTVSPGWFHVNFAFCLECNYRKTTASFASIVLDYLAELSDAIGNSNLSTLWPWLGINFCTKWGISCWCCSMLINLCCGPIFSGATESANE